MKIKLHRLLERVYEERDFARNISFGVAILAGVVVFFFLDSPNWIIPAVVSLGVFPIAKIVVSPLHSNWMQSKQREASVLSG